MSWTKILKNNTDGLNFEGNQSQDAILIAGGTNFTNINVSRCRTAITIRDDSHAQKNLTNISITDFCGDGIDIMQSNVNITNVEISLSIELIDYDLLHRDAIQIIGVDPKTHKADPYILLENIHIKKLKIKCINEDQYKGCQGVFSGDNPINNVTIDDFEIIVDHDEHGITIASGTNCQVSNGSISSSDKKYNPTLIFQNRKKGSIPMGDKIRVDNVECLNPVIEIKDRRILESMDCNDVANKHNISVYHIETIALMESNNDMFYKGKLKILFEPHVFWRRLLAKGYDMDKLLLDNIKLSSQGVLTPDRLVAGEYGTYLQQHDKLEKASRIDSNIALESCSYGSRQIMGFHWEAFGFSSVSEMVDCISLPEYQETFLSLWLQNNKKAVIALQRNDFARFCRYYVGSEVPTKYIQDFSKIYRRLVAKGNPLKKRTKSKTVIGASAGGIGGIGGLAVLADIFTGEMSIKEGLEEKNIKAIEEVIKVVKDSDIYSDLVKSKIDVISAGVNGATPFDPLHMYAGFGFTFLLIALGFSLVLWRYSSDNGY